MILISGLVSIGSQKTDDIAFSQTTGIITEVRHGHESHLFHDSPVYKCTYEYAVDNICYTAGFVRKSAAFMKLHHVKDVMEGKTQQLHATAKTQNLSKDFIYGIK